LAYRSRRLEPEGLRERIGEIAAIKRRYGYRRFTKECLATWSPHQVWMSIALLYKVAIRLRGRL